MVSSKEMASLFGQMDLIMKEISLKIRLKVLVRLHGQVVKFILEIGKKGLCMEEGICSLKMVEGIMDNFKKINFQGLEYLFGRMEGGMKDHGEMDFKKVMVFIASTQELF